MSFNHPRIPTHLGAPVSTTSIVTCYTLPIDAKSPMSARHTAHKVGLSASSTSPLRLDHGCAVWEAASMHQKRKAKRRSTRTTLRLPDLDYSKNSVLQSLGSAASKRTYGAAIEDFITWYCSEPRLAFGRTPVLRIRRLAYQASDNGFLNPDLVAGIRRVKGLSASE
jgi:hypothetical protein